ncbi:MAG: hypothetical protein OZ928_06200 [Polyangiaceae bacterium]|nr:hypothetical protein [Polyangiaceae bacterium]
MRTVTNARTRRRMEAARRLSSGPRHHLLGQRGPAKRVVDVENVEEMRRGVEVVAERLVLLVRRSRDDDLIDLARRGLLIARGVRDYS